MKEIITRLKELRTNKGYTQVYIAKYLNLAKSSYHEIESGRNSISIEYLIKLATLYNVSLDFLAGHNINIKCEENMILNYLKTLTEDEKKRALTLLITAFGKPENKHKS